MVAAVVVAAVAAVVAAAAAAVVVAAAAVAVAQGAHRVAVVAQRPVPALLRPEVLGRLWDRASPAPLRDQAMEVPQQSRPEITGEHNKPFATDVQNR